MLLLDNILLLNKKIKKLTELFYSNTKRTEKL